MNEKINPEAFSSGKKEKLFFIRPESHFGPASTPCFMFSKRCIGLAS